MNNRPFLLKFRNGKRFLVNETIKQSKNNFIEIQTKFKFKYFLFI